MKIQVHDLMSTNVVMIQPHYTAEQIRQKFSDKKINTAPVVDSEQTPLGIVSSSDLIADIKNNTPASTFMTDSVFTIPEYEGVEVAARMMRNHKIHHLIVTKEKKVIGIISSFDLLKLVENKKFEIKNPSTPKKRGLGSRSKAES